MRAVWTTVAAFAAGFAAAPRVTVTEDPAVRNKSLRIAVLEVYDGTGAVEPATLQGHLAQRLREMGYAGAYASSVRGRRAGWDPVAAAREAKSRGADAALVFTAVLAPGSPEPRRAEETETVYSDVSGRRSYYTRDLYGESYRGTRVKADATIVDARSETVVYRAELEAPARDLTEETLAALLLGPLED
jgi:hypothetical protein